MIRTLIVEDSVTVRQHLSLLMEQSGVFDVVGAVSNAQDATAAAAHYRPDLISLDVFLPGATASAVVRSILASRPVHIVLVSDAPRNSDEVFDALVGGALDILQKPRITDAASAREFLGRLEALSHLRLPVGKGGGKPAEAPVVPLKRQLELIVFGSSTGGPVALIEILSSFPAHFPIPIVVAQHISEGWEPGLVSWLSARCALKIAIARAGDTLSPGRVYVSPANRDVSISSGGKIDISPSFNRGYHPSADVLFSSAARVYGSRAVGVILSGIGSDGAQGAEALATAGGAVLAQSKETSIVYGMPEVVARQVSSTVTGSPARIGHILLSTAIQGGTILKV